MQISSSIITGGVASPNTQQITSATAASSVTAGTNLSVTLSTMGFNTGDRVYWQSTGTTANSTGSAVVTNTLGIIGSANFSVATTSSDNGTFNVFILNSQVSGSILRQFGPIAFLGLVSTYGWFLGGGPTATSIVDRIDFANDSPTSASQRGSLSAAAYDAAGVSNANYGWSAGGQPGRSSVFRVDYANDTANTTVRGLLTSEHYRASASSNANYGWISGGFPTSNYSKVDRIDFANDSPASSSPRGNLSIGRRAHGATGNANYGWHAGAGTTGIVLV